MTQLCRELHSYHLPYTISDATHAYDEARECSDNHRPRRIFVIVEEDRRAIVGSMWLSNT